MKRADKFILFIILIIVIITSIWVSFYKQGLPNNKTLAKISHQGKVIDIVDLSSVKAPYEFIIKSKNNGYNLIYLDHNKIMVKEANCPDKLCVKTGFLTNINDISVCLPHELIVEIIDGEEGHIDGLAN